MHLRDGHVPELQWEVMSSNDTASSATGPPVSIQLLWPRHITYDCSCYMLLIMLDMLSSSSTAVNTWLDSQGADTYLWATTCYLCATTCLEPVFVD